MSTTVEQSASSSLPTSPVVNFSRPNTAASSAAGSTGGGSLTRRSRISKGRRREDASSAGHGQRGNIERSKGLRTPSEEPVVIRHPRTSSLQPESAPARPPRSPRRSVTTGQEGDGFAAAQENFHRQRTSSTGADDMNAAAAVMRGRQAYSEGGDSLKGTRARGLSLPRRSLRASSPSDSSEHPSPLTPGAFNDVPPIPIFSRNGVSRERVRDSAFTQQSGTSSSVYPPSISTASCTESLPSLPSPTSWASFDRIGHVRSVDPEDNPQIEELHGLDADDVSYRLRLMVKNNYYLPPAHSKPYPSHLTIPVAEAKRASSKPSTPAFLDLFKVGKSRSKPTTPDAPRFPQPGLGPLPVLRTTSDSTTVSAYAHAHVTRSLPHSPLISANPHPYQDRKGRVVVVRERMEDLAGAAKQAEQDLKIREEDRRKDGKESSDSNDDEYDDIIDPTDAVDLPPPSSGAYPFPPQASALNGLGIDRSVGAAVLAERLPPASPGMWSVDTEDESWRKALLQEAVGHSLNNSPMVTPSSASPSPSQFPMVPISPISTLRIKRELGQRILPRIADEDLELDVRPPIHSEPPKDLTQSSILDRSLASGRVSSGSYQTPQRAETPAVPTHPLAPPPRKTPLTPIRSIFTPENQGIRQAGAAQRPRILRKAISSPLLPNAYIPHVGLNRIRGTMTPPPHSSQRFSPALVIRDPNGMVSIPSHDAISTLSSGSHYSEDEHDDEAAFHTPMEDSSEDDPPRPSLTVSLPVASGRPSSDYSQPSPTVSAFRDALDASRSSAASSSHWTEQDVSNRASRVSSTFDNSAHTRSLIMTPPPRASSSFSNTVLTPAPRSRSNYGTHASPRSSTPCESIRPDDDSSLRRRLDASTDALPAAQVLPVPSSYSALHPIQLSLTVPGPIGTSIHSTISVPPSPISFFDEVEMQHRVEDTSDEEDDDDDDDDDNLEVLEDFAGGDEGEVADGNGDNEYEVGDTASADMDDESGTESAIVFVDPTTKALSNFATGPQSTKSIMRLDNNSNPYLVPTTSDDPPPPMPYDSLDRRKPLTNVPIPSSSRSAVKPHKMEGRGRAFSAPRISEAAFENMKYQRPATQPQEQWPNAAAPVPGDRPSTSGGSPSVRSRRQEQGTQDESMRRLDGMLIQHMENERDTIRRITHTLGKS